MRVPANAWHTYRNVGETPGRFLAVFAPGGFERFIEDLGVVISDPAHAPAPSGPPDIAHMLEVCATPRGDAQTLAVKVTEPEVSPVPDVAALAREIVAAIDALPERSTGPMRAVRRRYTTRLRGAEPGEVVALAQRLLEDRAALRFVAYELIRAHPGAAARVDGPLLERLAGSLESWDAVDTFGCVLAGRAWQAGQVPDSVIHGWARSPVRWWRRAALVSTVPLNLKSHGGRGDARRTLEICRLLVDDRDDMVVKAMSWALRALATRDSRAVEGFLAEEGSRLASRVRREVSNKLSTGLKSPKKLTHM